MHYSIKYPPTLFYIAPTRFGLIISLTSRELTTTFLQNTTTIKQPTIIVPCDNNSGELYVLVKMINIGISW
jgi:hypothetical protein